MLPADEGCGYRAPISQNTISGRSDSMPHDPIASHYPGTLGSGNTADGFISEQHRATLTRKQR
jgi:hypothetical protein